MAPFGMGRRAGNGVAILARGAELAETCRGLPGDLDDAHSRYIEAAIGGILVGVPLIISFIQCFNRDPMTHRPLNPRKCQFAFSLHRIAGRRGP